MKDASIKRVWHIAPGAADEPGVVWAGADPGALFRSKDWGENWEQVSSLTLHPTREKWMPGAGGMCLHSIQPLGKGRIVVAISAAGAFRSLDGGETWEPHNGGGTRPILCRTNFQWSGSVCTSCWHIPKSRKSCISRTIAASIAQKTQQQEMDGCQQRGTLPLAFRLRALAVPAAEPDTMFTIPMEGAEYRCNPNGSLTVARSRDGGKTWKLLRKGLPQKNAHVTVLREAMTSDALSPAGVYFGTAGGTLYGTRNAGDTWSVIAENLPPVYSVTAA